ncbi:MAG: GntR family transcriptional regulator [Kiritimatiellae bacterium]|nr:GntR family transcriptional regulator [Kiritimatiellia bacterium]
MPAYVRLEGEVRRRIETGELGPGAQLPIERDLCRQHGVSRSTVRKALGLLAADGLILPIAGRGTFVTDPADPAMNVLRRRRARAGRANRTIAALIPCITLGHFPHIMRGIADECMRQGFQLTMGNFDGDLAKESEYLRVFMDSGVRGVIVSPHYRSHENGLYRVLQQRGIPLVLTDLPIKGLSTDLVATDNVEGAYEGTRRLIGTGCRRVGFVSGWRETITSQERLKGFRRAMREAKLRVEKALIREGAFSAEFGCAVWRDVFAEEALDGIFCANHPIASGILRAMAEAESGRAGEPPRMVSFDRPDVPPLFRGRLIVVAQPTHEMGVEACRLLLARIRESEAGRGSGVSAPAERGAVRRILLSPHIGEYTGEQAGEPAGERGRAHGQ